MSSEINQTLHSARGTQGSHLSSTRALTTSAVCVALLAVSAYISFPLPFTPAMVTALTIMVNLVGFLKTPKQAAVILGIYLLLGMVGVPVFVGGTSGMAKIFGPTGGFNLGFLAAVVAMSAIRGGRKWSVCKLVALGVLVGMPIIYAGGCISMYLVAKVGLWKTLVMAVFPFLIGDVLKVVLAAFLASRLQRYVF